VIVDVAIPDAPIEGLHREPGSRDSGEAWPDLRGSHRQASRTKVSWSARSVGILFTTAHSEIRNHSVKPLLFSFSDPNKS
jgi:hypothetical protein